MADVRALAVVRSVSDVGEQEDQPDELELRAVVAGEKDLLREQVEVLSRQVSVLEAQVRVLENTVAHMRDIWRVVGRLLDRHIEPES